MRILFICLLLLGPISSLHGQTLRIAMEGQFPPFESLDAQGQLQGFNVDIAEALCRQMQVECQLQRFAWDDLIPALQAQRIDLILASMSITPERLQQVDFSIKYAQTPAFFFARKGQFDQAFITPSRVSGKRIGVQQGTTYDRYLSTKYAGKAELIRFASAAETYTALQQGHIDLLLDDSVAGYFGFLASRKGQDFERVGSRVVAPAFFGQGQGIALRKGQPELKQRLDDAILAIRNSGEYQRIEKRYFNFFHVY